MSTPASPLLSPAQLATIAEIGDVRSAPVGEALYRVGDRSYPFIAIIEGEVAIIDAAGTELVRHGPSGFLGELNLLSGQTVFVTALVTRVTLLHRRGDLRETMSAYLIRELERYGVAVRDRSESAEIHGDDGRLDAVTLTDGERLPFSFLFLFLGAEPCTDWLDDSVARDADGFILTGQAAKADYLLQTDVPGVFAAGDVRSGSVKRCATAVGEGAMAVQLVHAHLSPVTVKGAR